MRGSRDKDFKNLSDEDLQGLKNTPKQDTPAKSESADYLRVKAEEEIKWREEHGR